MEWRDTGFVLAARRHGESGLIAELLTREHGRHAGLVRGGQSPRRRALFQPANRIVAHWRGRLPEHLGSLDCELVEAHAVRFLDDPDRLAAVTSAIALLLAALPEREPNADLYEAFAALLAALGAPESWARHYVEWECGLLATLGFGLDLTRCAATGAIDDLAFVSPRTGRAVSRAAAAPYRDKLLPLPRFMWRDSPAGRRDISVGLALTGYFLLHHLLEPHGRQLPDARERLAERLRRPASAV
ncbi:MAG: DNA repair protein RecO [Alphaproteobacteria bacterium]|nr:DNA repair protein RecO [Alphaproteobacteria bacterium]MBV9151617.1 DNA repair protein RecO [Alphaproteobacteria bacterium]MBV9965883.1 DNA repair protein RecO [Alphaproteobacteria bacterium]